MLFKMMEQRCWEWDKPLYISTIDFTKTFDRIKHHQFPRTSLAIFCIGAQYNDLLKRTVITDNDKESDQFEITRGTKQGDTLYGSDVFGPDRLRPRLLLAQTD